MIKIKIILPYYLKKEYLSNTYRIKLRKTSVD